MKLLISSIVDPVCCAHNRLHQMVKHLSGRHEITIISIYDSWKRASAANELYKLSASGFMGDEIRHYYLGKNGSSPVFQELTAFGTTRRIVADHYDVHLNYNSLINGWIVTKKLLRRNIPTVFDIADDLPEMIATSPQVSPALRPMGKFLSSKLLQGCIKSAVLVTASAGSLLHKFGVPAEKAVHLPNGVDTGHFFPRPACPSLKGSLNLAGAFVLGYVGVLREWVDFEPVLLVLRKMTGSYPNLRLLVIGEEGGLGNLKARVRALGLQYQVVFTGTIPYEAVPEHIALMDVGLIPFDAGQVALNALPLKLFEYYACGVPVLSTPLPEVKAAMGDAVMLFADQNELECHLTSLLHNQGMIKALGATGRDVVLAKYHWRGICGHLEQLLEQAAG